jgi:hypothetical protein
MPGMARRWARTAARRIHRARKLAAALVGAGVCMPAFADPVTIGTYIASATLTASSVMTAAQIIAITQVAFYAGTAAIGQALTRSAKRKAEAAGRAAFNASLQDRTVTLKGGVGTRGIIYGRTMLGGQLVFAHVSGTRGEFLHLVLAFSGHLVDAVEQVLFNDIPLPTPDGAGFIQSGAFAKTSTVAQVTGSSSTSIAIGPNVGEVQTVTRTRGVGDSAVTTLLTPATEWTFTGPGTVNIIAGHVAGDAYTVNWSTAVVEPRVRIKTYLGAASQTADADLIAESGGLWTTAHRGDGVGYVYIRLQFDQEIFGQTGVPGIKFLVRGKRVLDTRTGTTAWTQNAALCTRDYVLDTTLGMGAPGVEVLAAEANAAANASDELVLLFNSGSATATNGSALVTVGTSEFRARFRAGMIMRLGGVDYVIRNILPSNTIQLETAYTGTTYTGAYGLFQRRYQVNGLLDTAVSPKDNLDTLTAAMAGGAVWVQGRWLIRAGAGRALEMTINEDYLADGDISVLPRTPRASLFNTVTGTFISAAEGYVESQWPEVTSSFYRGQDNNARLARDIPFALTDDATACQRLGKIALERSRQAVTIVLRCNMRAYDLVPTDWVGVSLAIYGWSNKPFEVVNRKWLPQGVIEYTLREIAAAVYDWALGEQTAVDLAANTNLPSPQAPPPQLASLNVATGTAQLTQLADGTLITRGLVTWAQTTDVFTQQGGRVEIEWKLDNQTEWQAAPPEPGSATSALIGPLDDRRVMIVRIRPLNSFARAGAYTYWSGVVVGKTALPAAVTWRTPTLVPGAVVLSVEPTTELDVNTWRLKRGVSWAAGTRLDGTPGYTDIDGNTTNWAWPALGTYTIWSAWVDTSGNEGPATSVTVAVTASAINIGALQFGATLGGGNIVRNASFNVDSNADGMPDGWAAYSAGSTGAVAYTRPATGGADNGTHLQVTASALAAGGGNRAGVFGQQPVNLPAAGGPVRMSAFVQASGSVTVAFYVEARNAANAVLATASQTWAGPGFSWVRNAFGFTAPAGTTQITYFIWMQNGTGGFSALLVDAVQVEPGEIDTAFAPRADELLPGVVGTTEMALESATRIFSSTPLNDSGIISIARPSGAGSGRSTRTVQTASYTNGSTETRRVQVELYAGCAFSSSGSGHTSIDFQAVTSPTALTSSETSPVDSTRVTVTAVSGGAEQQISLIDFATVAPGASLFLYLRASKVLPAGDDVSGAYRSVTLQLTELTR